MANSVNVNDYLKHFGKELITKEIEEFAIEEALKNSRYMFIQRRGKERYKIDPLTEQKVRLGKQQYGYCTYCNKEYETEGLQHNGSIICPGCGSKVKIKSTGMGRGILWDEAYFIHYEKSKIDKDAIVAKGIFLSRSYKGDYTNIKTYYEVESLYVFKINDPVMLTKNWDIEKQAYCWEKRNKVFQLNNFASRVYRATNLKSIDVAIKDTPYQYSMYKEYIDVANNEDGLKYFELFSKYPRVEDLTKLGFKNIVESKLRPRATYSAINWNGKSVFKMLKVNKRELKDLIAFDRVKTPCFMRLHQLNSKEKNKLTLEELKYLEILVEHEFEHFKELLTYTTIYKINKYVKVQEKYYTNKFFRPLLGVISDWRDYIRDCKKLKMDITKESVLFPKDLYTAHQNTIKQIKYQEDKALDKQIKKREEVINSKYSFEDEKYLIRAVTSTKEIIDEGKELHHCVGGYSKSHANGKTNILVIREKNNIDKPFYTMEINRNVIIQVRGKRNCPPTEELNNFLDEFKKLKINKSKNKNNDKKIS